MRKAPRRKAGRANRGSRWEAVAFVLWVSRLVGLAPVRLHTNRRGCPANVWSRLRFYGYTVITITTCSVIAGTILDWQVSQKNPWHSVRMVIPAMRIAFVSEVVLLFFLTIPGVLGASGRIERYINYLNIIDKINNKTENGNKKYHGKTGFVLTVLYILCVIFIHIASCLSSSLKNPPIMCLYISFYIMLFMNAFLNLQFLWIALFIESTLNDINKSFEDLIDIMDINSKSASFITNKVYDLDRLFRPVNINPEIILKKSVKMSTITGSPQIKGIPERFRRLVILFGATCDVIAGVNDCFGSFLASALSTVLLHLVVTPFYFTLVWNLQSNEQRIYNILIQIVFLIYHLSCLFILIEPGHMTLKQLQRTKEITNRLTRRVATSNKDPLNGDLDLLLKQLELNNVCYRPMNMFTLNRELLSKIMGAVKSYLVIIFQYQQFDF